MRAIPWPTRRGFAAPRVIPRAWHPAGGDERGQLRFVPRQHPPAKLRLLQRLDRPRVAPPLRQRIESGPADVIPLGEILRQYL